MGEAWEGGRIVPESSAGEAAVAGRRDAGPPEVGGGGGGGGPEDPADPQRVPFSPTRQPRYCTSRLVLETRTQAMSRRS